MFDIEKDRLFEVGSTETIWKKYCGFLELSLEDFMVIQKALLMEQVELVWDTGLAQMIAGGAKPATVDEFRRIVPLTTYKDYSATLGKGREEVLAEKPAIWAHTSGYTGIAKWVPYTTGNILRLADDTLSAFILSAATKRAEVHLRPDVRVVLNLPPMPYITGIMAWSAAQRLSYKAIPPLEDAEKMSFQGRIQEGFKVALGTGVDFVGSIAVVMAKVGESFSQIGGRTRLDFELWHPMALWRVTQALVKSKLAKRPILPRDIWKVKGLVCGGTDTAIYRDQIYYYWGVQPLDAYVSTESGFIAMQGWNKKDMTFIPYSNFYEFIPEEEWLKSKEDAEYQPSTVLLDEVEPGKTYEIVITNFHGGAFLRYRLGDLIKITAMADAQTDVKVPQMVFQSRADELIDIAGFPRLDEKTIWAAIQNTMIPYEEWCARKESSGGKPILHLYIEPKNSDVDSDNIARLVDTQLTALDEGYRDLRNMTGAEPVKVTLLRSGTFVQYLQEKQAQGFDLAHLKPPHINASDNVIEYLLSVSQKIREGAKKKNEALSRK
jgi:phenylacetate-coenzyme A ligase PaaK-like adenylate-forming protein